MNSSPQQQNEAALHAVDYWQVIKNRYGIILLTLLLVFMTAAVITYVMPKKYESEATIEVKPRSGGMSPLGNGMREASGGNAITAQFFGTEFEKIKSSNSLAKVVDNLELMNKWGVNKETAIRILKGIVNTQNIRGTDLISIRVRHTSKEDARDVTAEVAKAYKEYRSEIENRDSTRALYELNKAVRDQEDKVEERRKVLATIVRTKGIIYKGQDSFYGQSGVDEDQVTFFHIAGRRKTSLAQNARHDLAVREVHLAAITFDIEFSQTRRRTEFGLFFEKCRALLGFVYYFGAFEGWVCVVHI